MSNNHSPSAQRVPSGSTTLLVFARIGAVLLALGVVTYLILNAQASSGGAAGALGEGGKGEGGVAVEPASGKQGVLLPSSKFRVIGDGAFSDDGGGPQLPEATKGEPVVMPSSKSLVLDPGTISAKSGSPALLFSSKSGLPIPSPTEPKDPKGRKQAVKDRK